MFGKLFKALADAPKSRVLFMRPQGTEDLRLYASSKGPILLQAARPPGDAAVAALAEGLAAGTQGRKPDFTTDPAAAGDSSYKVVAAFDVAANHDWKKLEAGDAGEPSTEDGRSLVVAFFAAGKGVAAVRATFTDDAAPGTEAFAKLAFGVGRSLFPNAKS